MSIIEDANTVFLEYENHSFKIARYESGNCKNVPAPYASGMLFTYKDINGYGWQVTIYNGEVKKRNISNNNFDEWS